MTKKIFLLIFLIISRHCIAMQNPNTQLIVVPGQNGLGGIIKDRIISNTNIVLPQLKDKRHFVETPTLLIDFGQSRCMSYLQKTARECLYHFGEHHLIHASSQGTATTLNYTVHNPANVKGLILEGIMLTGNSAIFHTTEQKISSFIAHLPGSYYWLPYLAKIHFFNYAPAGEQPIFNINKLPQDLPIIIIHNVNDPQLSFKDAQALYAYLCSKGNKNVYLFANQSKRQTHIFLLDDSENKEEITAIQQILTQYNLLPQDENIPHENINFTQYQPGINQEWLDHFDNLLKKETKLWYFDKALKLTLLGFIYLISQTDIGRNFLTSILKR